MVRHSGGTDKAWTRPLPVLFWVSLVVLFGGEARADHSLDRACLTCHSLRSTNVLAGSRNIACSNLDDPFYGYDATCASNSIDTNWNCSNQWDPGANHPLDCSYCHDTGGDIGDEIGRATRTEPVEPASPASPNVSFHPVDVRGTATGGPSPTDIVVGQFLCNDCHSVDVSANDPCDTSAGSDHGYPNHRNQVGSNPLDLDTGTNARVGPAAHLAGEYGPTAGENWGDGTAGGPVDGDISTVLCFSCHSASGGASDILAEYDTPYGGHNVLNPANSADPAYGDLDNIKLPCYDCHDPHASNQNEKLIIGDEDWITPDWRANPFGTSYNTGTFRPPNDFSAIDDDYVVCVSCHNGGKTVEGVPLPNVLGATITSMFPFHTNAHLGVTATTNCLNAYGGCHNTAHDVGLFRCLDCHTSSMSSQVTNSHIDSEFGHIGAVLNNGIQSVHSIPYDTSGDMSQVANNGCLACHAVQGQAAGNLLADADSKLYSRPATLGSWEDFQTYNEFCLSCHDGAGPSFTPTADYTLSDFDGGTITYSVGGVTLPPPQVNNKPWSGTDGAGYYFTSGHGRGQNDSGTLTYSPSGNPEADVPCIECHLYHGSTAFKLLPGDEPSDDGLANVVKVDSGPTSGTLFTIGGVADSTAIDYRDYTAAANNSRLADDFRSFYQSDYTVSWNTYWVSSGTLVPSGTPTAFGTSGDMRTNSNNSGDSVGNGEDATSAGKIGFCNACHYFNDAQDGTEDTFGWVYTHEGEVGGTTTSGHGNVPLDSQMTFFKDCAECHDPHGSGEDSSTGAENIYMIRGKVKHALDGAAETSTSWSRQVVLQTLGTGAENDNSFDEDDTGTNEDNADDFCTVCHTLPTENATYNVDHNARGYAGPIASPPEKHNQSGDCRDCHTHDNNLTTAPGGNIGGNGFGQRACTGCHGLPPISPCDTATDPDNELPEDYTGGGGAHKAHVDFLRVKLGIPSGYDGNLCIPCHGVGPGSAPWHNESNYPLGTFTQGEVDIVDGWGDTLNWNHVAGQGNGEGNFGSSATYDGTAVQPGESAKGGGTQACANLNCHGPGAVTVDGVAQLLAWDQMCPGGTANAAGRDDACAGCHAARVGVGDPATQIVAYEPDLSDTTPPIDLLAPYDSEDSDGDSTPDPLPQGVTASYFGTPSGYARGGHGDALINPADDPNWPVDPLDGTPLDPAPGVTTPSSCADCHDDSAAHFPAPAGLTATLAERHRLQSALVSGGLDALCNDCHPSSVYPGSPDLEHHPVGTAPDSTRLIYTTPSSWGDEDGDNPMDPGPPPTTLCSGSANPPWVCDYEQDGYSADGWGGQPDYWVDWWGGSPGDGTQAPPPAPAPFGTLPLEQWLLGSGTSNVMMCSTCHNPHGTDLFTFDQDGTGQEIPDNNMLRLRDSDSTLCQACH